MTFDVAATSYDRFMGRYSRLLSAKMADLAEVRAGMRVIDVGCGTGSLTGEIVDRVGAASVTAVDPSTSFVDAVRQRYPGVETHEATAEKLPFSDGVFDRVLAQLVVHFMSDPVSGLSEMRRVCRRGGIVAACVWDHARHRSPIGPVWAAAQRLGLETSGEAGLPGAREGHLGDLFRQAGFEDTEETVLSIAVEHPSFEDWWEPFALGVGPAGQWLAGLDSATRERLAEDVRKALPSPPFTLVSHAWAARART
jgi:SAM-dependent methyltransferase